MSYQRIDPAVRTAIETELQAGSGRSRAAIAREHGVSTRTVQRFADQLGLRDPWNTADTRKATEAATDRRRALRSQLADQLLTEDIPLLRAQLREPMRKTVVLPGPDGASTERVDEDDAVVARARQALMTSVGIAVDKTIAIDKHDVQDDADQAGEVLGKLFDGLGAAYEVLRRDAQADPADAEPGV